MRTLGACLRLLRLLGHVLLGVCQCGWLLPRLDPVQQEKRIRAWAQRTLQLLGLELVVQGTMQRRGPVLLVANHISWVDIVVLHACGHCRFISKADIQHWPLVASLASAAGTLYITRESRRDAMRVVHHMAESLRQGEVLALFPEGTTGDGAEVLPFHANLLQAAISADAPVQPVALGFRDSASGATSFAPCYIGEDTLLQSLWRTARSRGVQAVVRFGALQSADGRDRRQWAADLRAAIVALRAPG